MSHETTHQAEAQAEAIAAKPPTTEQLWKLFAQAERLASDARQLEREADDLRGQAEDLRHRANALQDLAETIAREADPPTGFVM